MEQAKNAKTLVLIRHGQSVYNLQKKFYGWHDPELTDLGRKQAEEILDRIDEYIEPDCIVSSDLIRAVDTAIPIAKKYSLELQEFKDFRELNHGDYEGLSFEEIAERNQKDIDKICRNSKYFNFPNGENYDELYQRARKRLDILLEDYNNIILVGHYGTIDSLMTGLFFGTPMSDNFFDIKNATINKIRFYQDGKISIDCINA